MSRLDDLEELREILRVSLAEAPAEKRGPLASQYRATLADIAALESSQQKAGDPIDEIAQRRAARGAGTSSRGVRAERSS